LNAMIDLKDYTFKTTAVIGKNNQEEYFTKFGIIPQLKNIYGVKKETPIYELEMKISSDQSEPNWDVQEYWGYYRYEDEKFTIIMPSMVMFNVCFPYGYKYEEEVGHGKAYRMEIIKTELLDGEKS